MCDSAVEPETTPPSATTAVAVVAQSAELAHGVAWLVASTTGPGGWEVICWSQFAGVARWTWSHNSGKTTGNIWPLSSSAPTSLTNESFMRWGIYHDAVMVVMTTQPGGGGELAHLRHATRYNGTETVLTSSPFASATSATAWPSFNEGVTLTARKPALARSAFCTAARSETFALAIAALWLCAAV